MAEKVLLAEKVSSISPIQEAIFTEASVQKEEQSQGIEQVATKIQSLLGETAELFNEEHAAAIYSEVSDCPDRFFQDQRKIYRELAKLEQERVLLVRSSALSQKMPYDDVLSGLRKRIADECKWLVDRFKFIYFKLRDEGEPFMHVPNIPLFGNPHSRIGIGPYLLTRERFPSNRNSMPSHSASLDDLYIMSIRFCDKELFLDTAKELIDLMANENIRILRELGQDKHKISQEEYNRGVQARKWTEEQIRLTVSDWLTPRDEGKSRQDFPSSNGIGFATDTTCQSKNSFLFGQPHRFVPLQPTGCSLSKSYKLEWEIESLKRCRQTLVVLNNFIYSYTELKSYKVSDKQPPFMLGLKKPLVFPKHFQRFGIDD